MDDEPFFIAANDDFEFQQGWDTPALEILRDNPDVHVVGLYDGNPHTDFSTIALVRRSYIEYCSGVVDMPRRVQFPYQPAGKGRSETHAAPRPARVRMKCPSGFRAVLLST